MAEPMKPKRGFVSGDGFADFRHAARPYGLPLHPTPSHLVCLPVLVVPEPDRDPTPEELDALAEALYATTAPGGLDGPFAEMLREVARSAWKLGARESHA